DPVYKVSIIPRGRALGVTMFLPEKDRLSMSRELLESHNHQVGFAIALPTLQLIDSLQPVCLN
ncbi:hypothetical protein, partial [Candidatus Marithrix sp. Canyon 246]|uniref:hypothetical protein n=1 Tax=Candidatus Marithrix sp. Canyon 246 TaxID=1827136 RepID=UPI000AB3073E